MLIYGVHAIEAALSSHLTIKEIFFLQRRDERLDEIKAIAKENKVKFREYPIKEEGRFEGEFKRLGGGIQEYSSSQGIFALVDLPENKDHLALFSKALEKEKFPIILALDSLTDPQNLGAILRTAAFYGVSGILLPEHRSTPLTSAAVKISSGGFIFVPVVTCTNLVRALEDAKKEGFWIVGLSEHAKENFNTARLDSPLVLVIGNEEKGMRTLVSDTCDYLLQLPGSGGLISLNAATAAAVAMTLTRDRQTSRL